MKIYNSPDGHLFVNHDDDSWTFVCFEGSDDSDWMSRSGEPPKPMDELVEWKPTAKGYPPPLDLMCPDCHAAAGDPCDDAVHAANGR